MASDTGETAAVSHATAGHDNAPAWEGTGRDGKDLRTSGWHHTADTPLGGARDRLACGGMLLVGVWREHPGSAAPPEADWLPDFRPYSSRRRPASALIGKFSR